MFFFVATITAERAGSSRFIHPRYFPSDNGGKRPWLTCVLRTAQTGDRTFLEDYGRIAFSVIDEKVSQPQREMRHEEGVSFIIFG